MTINKAMIRSGFLRYSAEAKHCGALRKRKPRSTCFWPLEPLSTSCGESAWASSALVARMLQAGLEGLQGLLGICFTGKRGAAQVLKGFGFALTVRAPMLVDCALRLGTAMFGVAQDPTLRDPAIARGPHGIAIPFREHS